mgnify:CR=1 FL=1
MSNQRAGKTHRASGMDNGSEMKLLEFFKNARVALEDHGDMDSAFTLSRLKTGFVLVNLYTKSLLIIS